MVKDQVLIIDDNELTRDALTFLLQEEGFSVNACADAASALELAKNKGISVYVVDYRMPGTTGAEVVTLLRKRDPESFIIGYSIELKEQEFLAAGADKFILKEHLVSYLAASMRTTRLRRNF